MKTIKTSFAFFLSALIFSLLCLNCSSDINEANNYQSSSEEKIRELTLQMINGTITDLVTNTFIEPFTWSVIVETEEKAIVRFEFLIPSRALHIIVGRSKPYTYNLNPGMNLLSFAKAKEIVLTIQSGEINWWILRKDKQGINWEYRFYITENEKMWDVRLNAANGTVIRHN